VTEQLERRVTQLRKGILELAILAALKQQRHYGYSLARVLAEGGAADLSEGTIYPILARMDRDGLVRTEWVESAQGPPRKYYALTAAGRAMLVDLSQEFDALVTLVRSTHQAETAEAVAAPQLVIRKRHAHA
jgi:PadR family transcriptional regulator PadR